MLRARKRREVAARKFQPGKVRLLLVAEAPPRADDRYFYFEDVASHDWLFRGVVEVLFGQKPSRTDKPILLSRLKNSGVFLIDLKLDPVDGSPLNGHVPGLVSRCQRLRPKYIVLIKASVYDAAYHVLRDFGLPVIDKRIPFPSTGQQGRFHRQFGAAVRAVSSQCRVIRKVPASRERFKGRRGRLPIAQRGRMR